MNIRFNILLFDVRRLMKIIHVIAGTVEFFINVHQMTKLVFIVRIFHEGTHFPSMPLVLSFGMSQGRKNCVGNGKNGEVVFSDSC